MERPALYEKLLSAVSAVNAAGTMGPGKVSRIREMTFYAVFGAGTTAGTIVIEGAHDPDFTGTWSNLGTLAWAAATSVKHLSVTGSHMAVRARVSVEVAGGTADCHVVGN